ncbi:hypothetical protein QAD02_003376 [Eretmocerus hayati]|uniref:Uncharacterized protein n=1 Tax=Eretmocerus hayati TaxID=131215 RepID=A0ACC2NPF0_9HYME|nr:hypothetical protein QAD02_003376 [Eretmocerus hayati]
MTSPHPLSYVCIFSPTSTANGIDSIEILQDLIELTPEKFGEWFPVFGTQLKIKRLCRDGEVEQKNTLSVSHNGATSSNPAQTVLGSGAQQVLGNQGSGAVVIVGAADDQGNVAIPQHNPDPVSDTGNAKKKVYRSDKPEVVNFDLEVSGRGSLKTDDLVLLRVPHLSGAEKKFSAEFFDLFEGPYCIARQIGENAFKLVAPSNPKKNQRDIQPHERETVSFTRSVASSAVTRGNKR